MKKFKFFSENLYIHEIFGENLNHVANLLELDRIIKFTTGYMQSREDRYRDNSWFIIVIMFKLFADKHNTYSDEQIIKKIENIEMWLNDKELIYASIDTTRTDLDIECEMVNLIYKLLNWDEE